MVTQASPDVTRFAGPVSAELVMAARADDTDRLEATTARFEKAIQALAAVTR